MTFPDDIFGEEFDPNEEKEYTYRCKLKPSARIVTAHVDIVDRFSRSPDLSSKASIVAVTFGLISGVTWGTTAYLEMLSEDISCCEKVWLRYRLEIDETPARPRPLKVDRTWGIKIKQL